MNKNTSLRRRFAERVLVVFTSRRVIVALSALAVGLLVMAVPGLEAVRGELLMLVITLALALIGGYSLSDAARLAREREALPPEQVRELVKDVLTELVDKISDEAQNKDETPQEKVNV